MKRRRCVDIGEDGVAAVGVGLVVPTPAAAPEPTVSLLGDDYDTSEDEEEAPTTPDVPPPQTDAVVASDPPQHVPGGLPPTPHVQACLQSLLGVVGALDAVPSAPTQADVTCLVLLAELRGALTTAENDWVTGDLSTAAVWRRCQQAFDDLTQAFESPTVGATVARQLKCSGLPEDLQRAVLDAPSVVPIAADDVEGVEGMGAPVTGVVPVVVGDTGTWNAVWDSSSASYYFAHHPTGATSWDAPAAIATPVGGPDLVADPNAAHLNLTGLVVFIPPEGAGKPTDAPLKGPFTPDTVDPVEAVGGRDRLIMLRQACAGCGWLRVRGLGGGFVMISFASHMLAMYAYWRMTGSPAVEADACKAWVEASLPDASAGVSVLVYVRYLLLADPKSALASPVVPLQSDEEPPPADVEPAAASPPAPAPVVEPVAASQPAATAGPQVVAAAQAAVAPVAARRALMEYAAGQAAASTVAAAASDTPTPSMKRSQTAANPKTKKTAASLINKWTALQSAAKEEDVDAATQRQLDAEEWRAEQLRTGASERNANFVPVVWKPPPP